MTNFRVYTIEEVAELLKLAKSSIQTYIREGKLKHARFGNRVRISEEHLKEFYNAHVVQGDETQHTDSQDQEQQN